VSAFLFGRQVAVADLHHVHVVVREEVDRIQVLDVYLHDRLYVLPGRADDVFGTWSMQVLESRDNATYAESHDMRQE
jgi:hypothetical protein